MTCQVYQCNVDLLFDNFDCKTLKVIDTITPEKVKTISDEQKAQWRATLAVTSQKRECRKSEYNCRKDNLKIHYIFKHV